MCPSPAVFTIGLGATNPQLIVIAAETSGFRRRGISPRLWLLVPTFSLRIAPPLLADAASLPYECSSTTHGLHCGDQRKLISKLFSDGTGYARHAFPQT